MHHVCQCQKILSVEGAGTGINRRCSSWSCHMSTSTLQTLVINRAMSVNHNVMTRDDFFLGKSQHLHYMYSMYSFFNFSFIVFY
jgi:hypothetical protein